MTSGSCSPIFVVGVPRSGTTLLAAMLGAHSRLSCGPETHFFSKGLARIFASRHVRRGWPGAAVEELFSRVTNYQPLAQEHGLQREEVTSYLSQRRPSVPAAFEAITELFMKKLGKIRWVEKTPRHLIHLSEIRSYYPRAPVLRIVRDPRDVALSILKAPWGFHGFLEALLYWQYLDALSAGSYRSDSHTYTVRYEDLLAQPEKELQKICAFIGEEYEAGMLDTSQSSRQVNRTHETWKTKVATALDVTRIRLWERELSGPQRLQAEALVGDKLREFGYAAEAQFNRYMAVFPMHALARYPDFIAEAVSRRVRFWPDRQGERPEEKLYIGHPERDDWLGFESRIRLATTMSIVADVLRSRLRRQPLSWVTEADNHAVGYCGRIITTFLPRRRAAQERWPLGTRQPVNAWR